MMNSWTKNRNDNLASLFQVIRCIDCRNIKRIVENGFFKKEIALKV